VLLVLGGRDHPVLFYFWQVGVHSVEVELKLLEFGGLGLQGHEVAACFALAVFHGKLAKSWLVNGALYFVWTE